MAASLALKSEGVILKRGDGAASEIFTAVAEIIDFDGPGGQAAVIDVTHLTSVAKEKLIGLPDEGQFSFNANLVPGDTPQAALRTDRDAGTLRNFTLTLTDSPATVLSFAAFVLEFRIAAGVDAKISVAITMEISGAVTWA